MSANGVNLTVPVADGKLAAGGVRISVGSGRAW